MKANKAGKKDPFHSALRYRTRWIAWGFILVSLAGCTAAVILRGGALEWYALSVLLGITVFSGILPLIASRGITAVRQLPTDTLTAGEEAEVRVVLERRWRMPWVWMSISEKAQNGTLMTPSALAFSAVAMPGTASRTDVVYSVNQLRRGVYGFRDMTITVGDWLGLTAIHRTIAVQGEMLVWPAPPAYAGETSIHRGLVKWEAADAAATLGAWDRGGLYGDSAPQKLHAAPGLGPDSRPYREGDSLRHLDMRAAARGRGIRVKTYAPEWPQAVTLWLDTAAEGYGYEDSRFEACIGKLALDARRLSRAGAVVSVATNRWTLELNGSDTSHDRHQELLELLSRLRADENREGADAAEGLIHATVRGGEAVQLYSGDWRSIDRWLSLSTQTEWQGSQVALHLAMEGEQLSSEMREKAKAMETKGLHVVWIPLALSGAAWSSAEKGAETHVI
ncbi:DUF58 domain-containing protein [Paenibacillus sp. strain BS8-2]